MATHLERSAENLVTLDRLRARPLPQVSASPQVERPGAQNRDQAMDVASASRLNPARGLLIGLPIGAALWAGVGLLAWVAFH